jgi:hypothetical protein
VGVVVIADHKTFRTALAEVRQVIGDGRSPANVIGGLAYEPKSASQLRGQWGGKLDKSLLIRTAREVAGNLLGQLPDDQLSGDHRPDAQPSGVRRPDSRWPDAQRLEAQRLEAQRLEAQRLEAQRLEAQRLEGQRLEGQRLEGQRLEGQRLEGQPLEGQPLEGQPFEGQPFEGQPFEGQPFEAANPPRLPAAGTGPEVTDHLGPLSGPPSATVPGVPAARPGDPEGW